MSGVSVAALAKTLVRIETGHVVSSSSMVSRAYLVDTSAGVVVDASEGGFWLVSALAGLVPDPDELRQRAADKGGIPVEHGSPRLVKITVSWGESGVDLNNPVVAAGSLGAGAVSLAVPASLGERIRSGDGPRPVTPAGDASLSLGESVAIVAGSGEGATVRWARVASDADFEGRPGAVVLDVGLEVELTGSPVFAFGDGKPAFCGLATPRDAATSLLVPVSALIEAIPTG